MRQIQNFILQNEIKLQSDFTYFDKVYFVRQETFNGCPANSKLTTLRKWAARCTWDGDTWPTRTILKPK